MKDSNSIIQVQDLSGYFFDRLYSINQKSVCPLPEETLFYSSNILNKYSISTEYHEHTDGKVSEKIFGIKLLEASTKSKVESRKLYKDIADTTLVLTGFFGDSINKKIIDRSYYIQIGKMAYTKMYSMDESFFGNPHFYKMMATSFEHLSCMMSSLNKKESLLSFKEEESKLYELDFLSNKNVS